MSQYSTMRSKSSKAKKNRTIIPDASLQILTLPCKFQILLERGLLRVRQITAKQSMRTRTQCLKRNSIRETVKYTKSRLIGFPTTISRRLSRDNTQSKKRELALEAVYGCLAGGMQNNGWVFYCHERGRSVEL